jgi:amino acid adenylation domain-containing protein
MIESRPFGPNLPPEQQAIRAKCCHPTGTFVEFRKEEVEQSIPDRFERIVRVHSDRLALETDRDQTTYAQLNRAANRIAHAVLATRGTDGEPVALLLENHASLIAATIGVLKAGKLYVPLDSSLPRARLEYIIEDSQAELLVTDSKHLPLARELSHGGVALMNIDELDLTLSFGNPGLGIPPDAPAWILYTSGSTGQPKGVVQNHRNVLHFVRTYTNGLHICPDDRLTLLFSYSTNGAAHDTFTALLNGASLHPFNVKRDGTAGLGKWLRSNRLTIYCSVPTVFRSLGEALSGEYFAHLRLIKLIGEPVYKRDVDLYCANFPSQCVLVNRLGSTETGTIRWHFIDKETSVDGNNVPVGYPVEDNEVFLLDDGLEKAPVGAIGEIAVKSRYLTPGYWRKPNLTSHAFMPAEGDERIYRTGDIGRMLTDGRLLCLGRKDSQVKIRGHRIEIAEVEMALLDLPAIKEAIVVPRENPSGDRRLVAYLVARTRRAPAVSELRASLSKRLPDYMLPSTWMFLQAFPLAPNGKVDRQGLPQPSGSRPELNTAFAAPQTPIEIQLAEIWSEILAIHPVGLYDNFFDLGGHSLAATQVVSRVIRSFQLDLPLQSLFQSPTVAEMAAVITASQSKEIGEMELRRILTELDSLSDDQARDLLVGAGSKSSDR